jgi:hypothetical protein
MFRVDALPSAVRRGEECSRATPPNLGLVATGSKTLPEGGENARGVVQHDALDNLHRAERMVENRFGVCVIRLGEELPL